MSAPPVPAPRLSRSEKFGYGIGDFASSLPWNAVGAFALLFYTDVARLSPAAIATMMLVTRIADACIDLFLGFGVDRTRTRWGRARPYLLFGAVPLGLLSVLVFYTPEAAPEWRLAHASITYFLLGLLVAATNIPYSAMMPMMTRDPDERLALSAARSIGTSVGVIVVTAGFMPLVEALGGGDQRRGFLLAAAIVGVLATTLMLVTFATCRERHHDPAETRVPLPVAVSQMLRNRTWGVAVGFGLLNFVRFGAIIALTPYFAIHVLQRPWMISVLLPAVSGTLLFGALLAPPLLRRWGMRRGNSVALLATLALYLLLPLLEHAPWAFVAVYVAASLCLSVTMTAIFAMAAAAVDAHEERFGVRQEGMLAAGVGFVIKVGMALGGALVAWGLGTAGYQPEAVGPAARSAMSWMYYALPCGVFLLQLLCIQFYPERPRPATAAAVPAG